MALKSNGAKRYPSALKNCRENGVVCVVVVVTRVRQENCEAASEKRREVKVSRRDNLPYSEILPSVSATHEESIQARPYTRALRW